MMFFEMRLRRVNGLPGSPVSLFLTQRPGLLRRIELRGAPIARRGPLDILRPPLSSTVSFSCSGRCPRAGYGLFPGSEVDLAILSGSESEALEPTATRFSRRRGCRTEMTWAGSVHMRLALLVTQTPSSEYRGTHQRRGKGMQLGFGRGRTLTLSSGKEGRRWRSPTGGGAA